MDITMISPLHCGNCGMPIDHAAEYHPIEFCILWENAYDPLLFVKEAAVRLGLVEAEAAPKTFIKDLPDAEQQQIVRDMLGE